MVQSLPIWGALGGWQELSSGRLLYFGEGNGTPLQYSCLENPMDEGAWRAAVHGVAKSRTRLSDFTLFTLLHWRRKWQPTPVFLPGKFHGQRSLVGCSHGVAELDTTEATCSSSSFAPRQRYHSRLRTSRQL